MFIKSPDNPYYTNSFLTTSKRFKTIVILETSNSDFHKFVVIVLNVYYTKQKPNITKKISTEFQKKASQEIDILVITITLQIYHTFWWTCK